MFILRPDLTEDQINQQMRKYHDLLKENGAVKVGMKVWGKRRLAYPIQKYQDGVYILSNFTGDGSQVSPVERSMRLSDEVIRYLTTKLKTDIEFDQAQFFDSQRTESESQVAAPIVEEKEETTAQETQTQEDNTDNEPIAVEA